MVALIYGPHAADMLANRHRHRPDTGRAHGTELGIDGARLPLSIPHARISNRFQAQRAVYQQIGGTVRVIAVFLDPG